MISVKIKTDQSVPLVIPSGRIDSTTSNEFDQALRPLIDKEQFLIIDLSSTSYLSSAGIRILLLSAKKLSAGGGGLCLCGMLPEVFQIIEMAGLHQVFRLFTTVQAAIKEVEQARMNSQKWVEWSNEKFSFQFHPIENKSEAALVWNNRDISGYHELGFSVGIGSPAETFEEENQEQGLFITTGRCAGFIPHDDQVPADFRIPQNPNNAAIIVSRALSFGQQPSGLVRMAEPGALSLGQLTDAIGPLKGMLTSEEPNLMALVVANFDVVSPSISIFVPFGQEAENALKLSGFTEIPGLTSTNEVGIKLWGARFVLCKMTDIQTDETINDFLQNILTFENMERVEIIHRRDQVVNPVTWIFISAGLVDAASQRLLIETENELKFESHKAFLARRLYTDSSRLVLKQIHGGFSAQTYQVTSFDHHGRKLRPTVLKISGRALISRESERCQQYAHPYILNNSAMVLGTAFIGNTGALRYNFVGIGGEQSQLKWLTHYFNHWTTEQLALLFDKIFLQILHPWYGQPIPVIIYPFKDHDPTFTFFPQLCEAATEQLSVSPDDQFFTVEETGQKLINPYWFLKHEFARRRETGIDYYTSICHGDLNMQNILLDEDMNVYLIDFSETRPRSAVSDFARLEAIFMIEHAPLHNEKEIEQYVRFISQFYESVRLDIPPLNSYQGDHTEMVGRNVFLTLKMREYALNCVQSHTNPIPYCIALLEWILPVVCYSSVPIVNKRLSMIIAGFLCKNVMDAVD